MDIDELEDLADHFVCVLPAVAGDKGARGRFLNAVFVHTVTRTPDNKKHL